MPEDTAPIPHFVSRSISASELTVLVMARGSPLLLDCRSDDAFASDERMLPGALRVSTERAAQLAQAEERSLVTYCVHGHQRSQEAAAQLAQRGLAATYLEGGIAAWCDAHEPTMRRRPEFGVPSAHGSRWVTRERPKIDRIACPWLIRRFIDPLAQFIYVPTQEVLAVAEREKAVAFDIPGAPIEHDGARCSFDTLLAAFDLHDPDLDALAVIVRGADTAHPELAAECAGLLAVSLGLSALFRDDHAMLDQGMVVYDALYAWLKSARAEKHSWNPKL